MLTCKCSIGWQDLSSFAKKSVVVFLVFVTYSPAVFIVGSTVPIRGEQINKQHRALGARKSHLRLETWEQDGEGEGNQMCGDRG